MKEPKKRSKQVYGKKPESIFHIKETLFLESYPGGPKRVFEQIHAVDDFSFSSLKPINYG